MSELTEKKRLKQLSDSVSELRKAYNQGTLVKLIAKAPDRVTQEVAFAAYRTFLAEDSRKIIEEKKFIR